MSNRKRTKDVPGQQAMLLGADEPAYVPGVSEQVLTVGAHRLFPVKPPSANAPATWAVDLGEGRSATLAQAYARMKRQGPVSTSDPTTLHNAELVPIGSVTWFINGTRLFGTAPSFTSALAAVDACLS